MPGLEIDVTARIAQATDALEQVSKSADRMASKLGSSFSILSAGVAGIVGAFSVDALKGKFDSLVSSMAALDDASEMTGVSVESLSSLLNTLRPSGASLETITDAAGKLARAMQEARDGTGKQAEAFKALGISVTDAKGNLRDTGDVMKDIADKFSTFEDGTNKVALAQAFFGKTGANLLPILKDLAQTQKVAASVSGEQAAEAERLEKAMAKMAVESDRLWTSLASRLVPALADLAERFNKAGEAGAGFISKVYNTLTKDNELGSAIEQKTKQLEDLKKRLAFDEAGQKTAFGVQRDQASIDSTRAQIVEQEKLLRVLQERKRLVDFGSEKNPFDEPAKKPAPNFTNETTKTGRVKADRISDGEREIEQLTRQILLTGELTEAQKLEVDIALGKYKDLTTAQKTQMRALAEELTQRKQSVEDEKEAKKILLQLEQDKTKGDEALAKEIEARGKLAEKYREIADPAEKFLRILGEINSLEGAENGLDPAEAANARSAIYKDWAKSIEGAGEKTKGTIDFAKDLGVTFESAFEKAIFGAGKFSDALKGLLQDIARIVLRKTLTEPLTASLLNMFKVGSASKGGNVTGDTGSDWSSGFASPTKAAHSIAIYQSNNFSGGADVTTLAAWSQQTQAATLKAVREQQKR